MKHLKLFFACLLMAVLSIGQVCGANATIAYSGNSTTNMTGNNDAATVGLDASSWSVVGAKGNNQNFPGLNKNGYIAVYYNATASNTITVTNLAGATINTISITYTGNSYNNGVVKVGNNTITPTDGVYTINSTSFVITNGNTSNVQVRISSIAITYTSGSEDPTLSFAPFLPAPIGSIPILSRAILASSYTQYILCIYPVILKSSIFSIFALLWFLSLFWTIFGHFGLIYPLV